MHTTTPLKGTYGRKTIAVSSIVTGLTGASGILLWLFDALGTLLRSINLEMVPESWAAVISFLLAGLGLVGAAVVLRGSEPESADPAPDGG